MSPTRRIRHVIVSQPQWSWGVASVLVAVIIVVGVKIIFFSHASTTSTYISAEAESGALTGGAVVAIDRNASGGNSVQFGTPAPTPTPTPVPTPTPTPLNCIAPTNYPPPPVGGLAYTNWYFNISDIYSIQNTINIYNDPGNTSDLYLQLYDANIDNTGQYYGLQTTGTAIFSRFGTTDTSNVIAGTGSTVVAGTNEGPFVSLRHNFNHLPVGSYSTRVVRANYDGVGDWFDYYVTFPGQKIQLIGAIRFPRANPSVPASFNNGGGTWTEFWDNNGSVLFPVPLWHVSYSITAVSSQPISALASYSPMPDSDEYAESPGGLVDQVIGGSTPRCHPAGWLWYNIGN